MKVKVITCFIDKTTNNTRKVGEIFEVTEERYNEIKAKGKYVQKVKEAKAKPAEKAAEKAEKRG